VRFVSNSSGARINNAIVLRLCARISGSMGRSTCAPPENRPVNIARPIAADSPQQNVAAAINR